MKHRIVLIVALSLFAFAACSEDNKVGSGVDLNVKEAAGQGRLGERTTTTAAPTETTAAPQGAALGRPTTTAAPATTAAPTTAPPTTQAATPTFDIAIMGDNSGTTQFDPAQARVFQGYVVKFTNRDTKPRSVEADQGEFSSGPLQPGETWSYKADEVGKFNYHDGTRPYAVALLEVVAR